MSLSDEVSYFTGEIDSLHTPAPPLSCTAFAVNPRPANFQQMYLKYTC